MKTIYTDRYSLHLWIWLLLGLWCVFKAITSPLSWITVVPIALALGFFYLAAIGLKARIEARREGEDPAIYKVVDDA